MVCEEQEVVALGGDAQMGPEELKEATAPHVSPQQFHSLLGKSTQDSTKDTVLLDVRNLYETRVGHFDKVRRLHKAACMSSQCTIQQNVAMRVDQLCDDLAQVSFVPVTS